MSAKQLEFEFKNEFENLEDIIVTLIKKYVSLKERYEKSLDITNVRMNLKMYKN